MGISRVGAVRLMNQSVASSQLFVSYNESARIAPRQFGITVNILK
jgi:hypothetical protein